MECVRQVWSLYIWYLFMQCDFALACWSMGGFRDDMERFALEVDSCEELFCKLLVMLDQSRARDGEYGEKGMSSVGKERGPLRCGLYISARLFTRA